MTNYGMKTMCKIAFASLKQLTMTRRCIHFCSADQKKVPSNLKGKSKSSQEWLTRQLNDPYVKKAQEMNYRARSAFKLIEIDDKAKILRPGQTVIECGAAPGAWTQVIVKRINADGKVPKRRVGTVIGIDLLPIAPLDGAVFLSGCDFTRKETLLKIQQMLVLKVTQRENELAPEANMSEREDSVINTGRPRSGGGLPINYEGSPEQSVSDNNLLVDVVLSDMAPNATGFHGTDHPKIIKLAEAALAFAVENGRPKGHFLTKLWDGSESKRFESLVASHYEKVTRYKPASSRSDSSEFFLLGKYKK